MRIRVESPGAPAFDTELVPPEVIVGRANTAGIVIDNRSVSRHHARFTRRGHSWWLEDLGATNPTIYNGHPLQAPVALAGGDAIRIGDSVLTVVDEARLAAARRRLRRQGRRRARGSTS
jgi:pSer/pThr/pTyr-binding forkhead associated (FHA) protein